jgi:hypothetical protein
MKRISVCEIKIFRGAEYEDGCLLGCCTALSGRYSPTFERNMPPPLSGTDYYRPDCTAHHYSRQLPSYLNLGSYCEQLAPQLSFYQFEIAIKLWKYG